MIRGIRDFFVDGGFLEIETPCRIPAPAPEAHIDAIHSDGWYLQTSPELYMKRLLAAGYPKLFQIARCFRNGERGERHLPEFTLLEWYHREIGYHELMRETEDLVRHVCQYLGFGDQIVYGGETVDLSPPWQKMTVSEAFDRYSAMSVETAVSSGRFDEAVAFEIEPNLGRVRPVFLHDYPAEMAALARRKPENPSVSERFELYICGIELCNGFGELVDPAEQRRRFEKEIEHRASAGKPVYPMPEKFLEALADMPEASGNALGVDRLAMLFAGVSKIDDVVAFATEEL